MAMATAQAPSSYLSRSPNPSGLADVLNIILDKGLVIDAYVRVSLVGIELLTVDARVVIASADTYLRFAEATNRLDLAAVGPRSLPDLIEKGIGNVIENVAANVVEHKIEDVKESVRETVGGAKDAVQDVVGEVAETVEDAAHAVTRKARVLLPGDGDD